VEKCERRRKYGLRRVRVGEIESKRESQSPWEESSREEKREEPAYQKRAKSEVNKNENESEQQRRAPTKKEYKNCIS